MLQCIICKFGSRMQAIVIKYYYGDSKLMYKWEIMKVQKLVNCTCQLLAYKLHGTFNSCVAY